MIGDPELRHGTNGHAVVNFTLSCTPQHQRKDGTVVTRDGVLFRCTAWRALAEHVAASLHRGDRVVVVGSFHQDTFRSGDGEQHSVLKLTADEVALSLRYEAIEDGAA